MYIKKNDTPENFMAPENFDAHQNFGKKNPFLMTPNFCPGDCCAPILRQKSAVESGGQNFAAHHNFIK